MRVRLSLPDPRSRLTRYAPDTGTFTLLDPASDMGNNVFDGGEGYAHMQVLDPRGGSAGRILWTGAVIEGDRDPSDPTAGFPLAWTAQRGWFGALTLPRVLELMNVTHDDGGHDVFLATPPLPELAALRDPGSATSLNATISNASVHPLALRGRSLEVDATFEMPRGEG